MNEPKVFSLYKRLTPPPEKSIEGQSIVVSVVDIPPMVFIAKDKEGRVIGIDGYLADLWKIIEEQLKFRKPNTMKFEPNRRQVKRSKLSITIGRETVLLKMGLWKPPKVTEKLERENAYLSRTVYVDPGDEFIGTNHNGTWDGMIGSLQAKKADIGLVNFGVTLERKQVIDFSAAVEAGSSMLMVFSKTDIELIDWMTFATIFSWKLWLFMGILWLSASLFLGTTSGKGLKDPYSHYFFYFIAVITLQGWMKSPSTIHSRIIIIWFWATCLLTYITFTALLTTELTTSTYKPLTNLKEALEFGYKVAVIRGTIQHDTILQSQHLREEYRIVAKMLKQNPSLLVNSTQEGIEATLDKKTLFYSDSMLLKLSASKNCSFSLLPHPTLNGYSHLAYRKDFEFKEALNIGISRLLTTGVTQKIIQKWITPTLDCVRGHKSVISLGLTKTSFAFALVICGISAALVILVLELCLHRIRTKKSIFPF